MYGLVRFLERFLDKMAGSKLLLKFFKLFFEKYLTNAFGFAIIFKRHDGRLAQLGEHLPYKQRVTGSSPVLSTKEISG